MQHGAIGRRTGRRRAAQGRVGFDRAAICGVVSLAVVEAMASGVRTGPREALTLTHWPENAKRAARFAGHLRSGSLP